jgi:2-polyprenyl-3-methyl-5-hydroxy-6-metoxy-1,4-benzoquinol methylase
MMNSERQPLYEMQPEEVFCQRAENYAKYRPPYPPDAISQILQGFDDLSQITVVDVGAGTGIAACQLADRGGRVIAIEPNPDMRAAAISHPLVEYRDGVAEQIALPDASVDLVTCFQSFHWLNPNSALLEFRRILKPMGKLAIAWNNWLPDDPCFAEFRQIIRQFASHPSTRNKHHEAAKVLNLCPQFRRMCHYQFRHQQQLDRPSLIGYACSKSFAPIEGATLQQLTIALEDLHHRWADDSGFIKLNYQTDVFLASRTSRFLMPLRQSAQHGYRFMQTLRSWLSKSSSH